MPAWKRLAYAAIAAAACLFALIATNIAAGDPLVLLDVQVTSILAAHRIPALTLLMIAITNANAPPSLCAYACLIGIHLYRKAQWPWLLALGLAVPVGLALNAGLKHLFLRTRPVPDHPMMMLDTYSFPSGHTAGATLFYGFAAAYLVSRTHKTRLRAAIVMSCIGLAMVVAFSRVYLGVHYLSDVLGAAAWSLAWLAICLLAAHRAGPRPGSPK